MPAATLWDILISIVQEGKRQSKKELSQTPCPSQIKTQEIPGFPPCRQTSGKKHF